jgi:hypothetical protein
MGFFVSAVQMRLCRSELARDKPENTAGHLPTRVNVDDHREHARSYSGPAADFRVERAE